MRDRKKTVLANITMVSVTFLTALLVSIPGNAREGQFNSQGRIIFDNKTSSTTDDVVFDAADFDRLAFTCR